MDKKNNTSVKINAAETTSFFEKIGVEESGLDVFCANCGYIISKTGSYDIDYCARCKAPVSINALEKYLKENDDTND